MGSAMASKALESLAACSGWTLRSQTWCLLVSLCLQLADPTVNEPALSRQKSTFCNKQLWRSSGGSRVAVLKKYCYVLVVLIEAVSASTNRSSSNGQWEWR